MARDYSNRGSSNRGKSRTNGPTRSNGASRKKPQSQKRKAPKKNTRKSSGTPGWVWMASGLCIGLTVAAAVYIMTRPTGPPGRAATPVEVPQPEQPADTDKAAQAEQQSKPKQPRFAFYEMLPDYEVVIPQESYPSNSGDSDAGNNGGSSSSSSSSSNNSSTSHGDNSQAAAPAEPQPTTPTVHKPGRYVIQAGSFSTREDATRRKAELALLGMQANVLKFQLESGQVVYRVRSETIKSNNRLTELLKRLRDNSIGTLVLRQSQ